MAYRTFVDPDGVSWQVWEVRPTTVERRLGERRIRRTPYAGVERRGRERRTLHEQRIFLGERLSQGWLAFHSAQEKRRLAPIPEGWERLGPVQLSALCAEATTVSAGASGHYDNMVKRPA
jgi:hypothetical protein